MSTTEQSPMTEKENVRWRVANAHVDPDNYVFIPAKKQADYYDNDIPQRVAIYVRVSTDSSKQTMSYELQKKYYEEFVVRHPRWTLVKIYADEGISGTSLNHRDGFNEMIADCKAGKIDMIITKSVSRFARNIVDCISMVVLQWSEKKQEYFERHVLCDLEKPLPSLNKGDVINYVTHANVLVSYELSSSDIFG